MAKQPRRRCKICREWFHPRSFNEWWCSPEHGAVFGMQERDKQRQKVIQEAEAQRKEQTKAERRSLKIRKLAVKPTSYFKAKAQQAFNEFIRTRDHDQPCISCGETNPPDLHGGQWDCGHFKTVGGFPELRFVELNAYRQCKPCNAGSAKHGAKAKTVGEQYEANLIEKIGQEAVDWLNGPHEMTNYRRDDYIRIRDEYRAKTRVLKKQLEAA
jgi:hypothetical protein